MEHILASMGESFLQYYGMDWMALAFGLYGMRLITHKKKMGFFFSGIGCICGLCAALIGQQFGFVVYNAAVIYLMAQGFRNWDMPRSQDDFSIRALELKA